MFGKSLGLLPWQRLGTRSERVLTFEQNESDDAAITEDEVG